MDIDQDAEQQDAEAVAPKKPGWPKGKPRGPRTAAGAATPRSEEVRPEVRTRKRKGGQLNDKFAVDPRLIPQGMSWEWKTESVYGRADPSYQAFMREQGWEPVMAERYPGTFMEDTYRGPIRRDGMILMERPMELTKEAMMEDRLAARQAVQIKEQQLSGTPDGQLPRQRADGSSTVSINKSIERGGIEIE